MKQLTHKQLLTKFLKYHRAHSAFILNNEGEAHFNDVPCHVVEMIRFCGFIWSTSPEGLNYWISLNNKWEALCINFNISGTRYVK